MNALSLSQPWATLIAVGAKRFETRHWRPPERAIGQLIAIHARKKFMSYDRELVDEDPLFYEPLVAAGYHKAHELPLGAIVAVGRLGDVERTEMLVRQLDMFGGYAISEQEQELGDWTSGRFAWRIDGVLRLATPIPYRGEQGLFTIDDWIVREALDDAMDAADPYSREDV